MALAGGAMTVAAAGMAPKVATKVFGYNRENFMEDREQRMKKEFKEREFRIVQSKLWREDVRDFVSLTEQKMSLYLIINVLLLSFTVTLWVEGQLPETTPDWLVMGYQISCVVAFSFLVLTIWLAMHAAVAAQSYQTRVLTQLVRLPIPTWQELEACRTAASEFEKIESRQMFRVPFVTGSQESFVPGHTAPETGDLAITDASRVRSGNSGHEETVKEDIAADPWGLEQRGDNVYELGTHSAAETANLRHIKLMRQAAVYWQTYDAFARVSMSVGINQLMLGLSYFILGYGMLEVKAPCAAVGGVLVFMGSAEVIARVDLTLPVGQQRLVQLLVAIGPMISCIASYLWSFHRETQAELSELLAPLAYLSNGFAVGIMTIFVQVEEQENGAMVPNAFRSVLFLDVFAWVSQKKEPETPPSPTAEEAQVVTSPVDGPTEVPRRKPAASAVNYDKFGNSLPATARDTGPAGSLEDFRYVQGAPRSWETVNAIEPPAKEFWDPVTFMPSESRERSKFDDLMTDDARDHEAEDIHSFGLGLPASPLFSSVGRETPIVTGHDNEAPGAAPWKIFRNLALVTCLFWFCAGTFSFMKGTLPQLVEMGLAFADPLEEEHTHPPQMGGEGPKPVITPGLHTKGTHRASLFEVRRTALEANGSELITARWPYPGMVPKGLSCDIHGKRLLVTDGLSMYLAELESIGQPESQAIVQKKAAPASLRADFQLGAACPSLLGERLQDTAIACEDTSLSSCEALVLHRQGRRLASCKMTADAGSQAFDVSSSWLSKPGQLGTSKLEQTNFLMLDTACTSSASSDTLSPGCTSVGSSLGRSARLQLASRGSDLIPLDVIDGSDSREDPMTGQAPDGMRFLTERYMGVLNATDKSIEIQDLEQGGARIAKLALGSKVPVQAFCASRDHIYLLGSGAQPEMVRIPLPAALKQ